MAVSGVKPHSGPHLRKPRHETLVRHPESSHNASQRKRTETHVYVFVCAREKDGEGERGCTN